MVMTARAKNEAGQGEMEWLLCYIGQSEKGSPTGSISARTWGNKGATQADIWEEYSRQRNTKCKDYKVSQRIRLLRMNIATVRYISSYSFGPKIYFNLFLNWWLRYLVQHLKAQKCTQWKISLYPSRLLFKYAWSVTTCAVSFLYVYAFRNDLWII